MIIEKLIFFWGKLSKFEFPEQIKNRKSTLKCILAEKKKNSYEILMQIWKRF